MKKFKLIVAIVIAISVKSYAQTDSIRLYLDHIFQYIDKSQIPFGYLDEYGAQFLAKHWLNGVLADSNVVPGMSGFRFMYNDIESARIYNNAPTLPSLESVDSIISQVAINSASPLIFLTAQYSTLREDAIGQNLFTYSNDQIFDVSNRTESPYVSHDFFAACPILEKSEHPNILSLAYNASVSFSNSNKTISSVWIDFLDGQGYHFLAADSVIDKTYNDSSGFKTFAIKVIYTDSSVFYCYSRQYVDVVVGASRYATLSDIELANPAYISHNTSNEWHDAKIYVRYSSLRNGTALEGKIVKPFIVVEGYDIHDEAPKLSKENYNINDLITEWNNVALMSPYYDFNKELDETAGYDFVFVDYYTMDYIQNNAKMLQDVIEWVNNEKVNNAQNVREQNVVMGISLGGILTRYTLAKMTKNLGTNSTEARLLITHDSPHQGANVPLGFQFFLYDFGEVRIIRKIKDVSAELSEFYHLNEQPATQQLLMARVTNSSGDIAYNSFMAGDYRDMITFQTNDPQPSYTFIATSQGSQCARWTMTPGATLISMSDNVATANWIAFGLLMSNKYKLTVQVNALPQYGTSQEISYVKMQRNIRLFFGAIGTGWKTTYESQHHYSPSNMIPWDAVPGGTQSASGRSGGSFSNNSVWPDPFASGQTFFGALWRFFLYPLFNVHTYLDIPFEQDIFTHVPITSALDVDNVTINTFNQSFIFPVTGANGSRTADYIAQNQFTGTVNNTSATLYNLNHTDFTARNSEWIYNKMENVTPNDPGCTTECSGTEINGSAQLCSPENYSVSNLPSGATVTWSANPSSGVISLSCTSCNSTTATAIGNGQVTLSATYTNSCGNVTATKVITVSGTIAAPGITADDCLRKYFTHAYTATSTPSGGTLIWGYYEGYSGGSLNIVNTNNSVAIFRIPNYQQYNRVYVAVETECGVGTPSIVIFEYSDYCEGQDEDNDVRMNNGNVTIRSDQTAVNAFKELKVYPNPSENYTMIELPNQYLGGTVRLVALNGHIIKSERILFNTLRLNITNYASGIYFIEVQSKEGLKERRKIVIAR